jgi:hypothetical protein
MTSPSVDSWVEQGNDGAAHVIEVLCLVAFSQVAGAAGESEVV